LEFIICQPAAGYLKHCKKEQVVLNYNCMSPSIFREKGYRFYFLSNEEERIHIHVTCEDGEAKF